MNLSDTAVEAAAKAWREREAQPGSWTIEESAGAALEAAAPYMFAQALEDAVQAFPLETIHAPDNAVVWMMRRAEQIREGGRDCG